VTAESIQLPWVDLRTISTWQSNTGDCTVAGAALLMGDGHDSQLVGLNAVMQREGKAFEQDLTRNPLRRADTDRELAESVEPRWTARARKPTQQTGCALRTRLGHPRFRSAPPGVKTTQQYLNVSDQELLKTMTGVWEKRKLLRAVNG
jgi:hypothetical protein